MSTKTAATPPAIKQPKRFILFPLFDELSLTPAQL
jgi:hypothetical protein